MHISENIHMDSNIEEFSTNIAEYISLLEQFGIKDEDTSDYKKRDHRRFVFDSPDKTILLQIGDDTCSLFDVSVGGMSFYSKNEYEVGKQLNINFDDKFSIDIFIVNTYQENNISNGGELFYLHGAKFFRKGDGLKCTIAVLKYHLEIKSIIF